MCQQQQAGGKRKKTAVWKIIKKKFPSFSVTELMKQSFCGVFCFLAKQNRESNMCNSLDNRILERMKDSQEFESEVAPGAQPHGKQ